MTFVDTYSQPEAPDPVLSEEVVVGLARRHVAEAGRLLSVDESGGEARAYHLDGGVVVKTQRPPRRRPRTSLEKEGRVLQALDGVPGVSVPRALGHGWVDTVEYLCLSRMPGRPFAEVDLPSPGRREVLLALGDTLRRIHESDQSPLLARGLVPGDEGPEDFPRRVAETFDRLFHTLEGSRSGAGMASLREGAMALVHQLPSSTPPVVLHSNPGPEHVFVLEESGTLSGLIDFGDAYRSHPALDLRSWPRDRGGDVVLEGYRGSRGLPEGFETAWRAGLIITELTRAVRGGLALEEVPERVTPLLATDGVVGRGGYGAGDGTT
ncbi:MAG: phosphotransferase [Acidobacteria bacterium]|nr:phosphotransferase [Acidobacteriota bacterium]